MWQMQKQQKHKRKKKVDILLFFFFKQHCYLKKKSSHKPEDVTHKVICGLSTKSRTVTKSSEMLQNKCDWDPLNAT